MFGVGIVGEGNRHLYEGFLTPVAKEIDKRNLLLIGLQEDELAVGALAGQIREGAFYILSLFVAPSYRRQGGGKLLMEGLTEAIKGMRVPIRAEVLNISEESKSAIAFFEYIGCKRDVSDKAGIYLAKLEDLLKDDLFRNPMHERAMKDIYSMKEIDEILLKMAEKKARVIGAPLPDEGIFASNVDVNVSAVHKKNHAIDGYAIMDDAVCGYPSLSSIWSMGAPANMVGLLRKVAESAKKKYPVGTKIAFFPVNDVSVQIMQKIAPGAENVTYRFTLFE